MSELARFQDAFTAALSGADHRLTPWLDPTAAAGLSVYRNTVAKGMTDALAANFPTVERLVGEDWFRAAAGEFAAACPPLRPALLAYGETFPAWLATFPPAASMPYLAAAARADRLWIEAHLAADADPLGAATLASLNEDGLSRTRARLHPSARLAWFEDNSASLWLANRPSATPPDGFELTDRAEGLLLVRAGPAVRARRLDAAAFAFLSACAEGQVLAEAAARALRADPAADLAAIVTVAFEDGLFVALEPVGESEP